MQDLQKVRQTSRSKRVGRGYGSGRGGHTAGRGMKGQKSRSNLHILFEGLKMRKSLLSRLPFKRGKNKFKSKAKPVAINLSILEKLDLKEISEKTLVESGVVTKGQVSKKGVKILGEGKVTKKLTVKVPVSKSAKAKIEKAGGKIEQK